MDPIKTVVANPTEIFVSWLALDTLIIHVPLGHTAGPNINPVAATTAAFFALSHRLSLRLNN